MSDNPEEHVMTFWEHLEELRARMVRMILAFLAGGGLAWAYKRELLNILTRPFEEAWKSGAFPGMPKLVFMAPADAFMAYVKLSAMSGAIFALPIVLYQIWAFVAPGLYSREKRFALPFVIASCGLFAGGGYFGWKFAFPKAFAFLLSYMLPDGKGGVNIEATVTLKDYLEFVTHMLVAFGVAFELPVLSFFLSIAGIVDYKQLLKFFRYFIVVAFIISAVLTPPDPLSQLLLAIPLCGLYGISIVVAYIFGRKPPPEEETPKKEAAE
ncbi:MAG TPA: twin-arginine translocase subunit TatC [Polyangiaceae bacterium]|nr:twin-arginine translocase subunit TatC [Polyangiaceae bacterium]